jgi:uncharacterized protein YfbU (UPF0304 family)
MFLIELLETQKLVNPEFDKGMQLEALRNGYPDFYGLEYIVGELSHDQTEYAFDVLFMYERIQDALRNEDGSVPTEARCPGFDGNYEAIICGFVRFLADNGRYAHIVGRDGDYPNSHGGQPDYRAMLGRFDAMVHDRSPRDLTPEEARELLAS